MFPFYCFYSFPFSVLTTPTFSFISSKCYRKVSTLDYFSIFNRTASRNVPVGIANRIVEITSKEAAQRTIVTVAKRQRLKNTPQRRTYNPPYLMCLYL